MKRKTKWKRICEECGEPLWTYHHASVHCRIHPKIPAYKENNNTLLDPPVGDSSCILDEDDMV